MVKLPASNEQSANPENPTLTLDFNPAEIAGVEVDWWKAHHEDDRDQMVKGLATQQVFLYKLEPLDALSVVTHLGAAAFHHNSKNWEPALAEANAAYRIILDKSPLPLKFDPTHAAQLELEWVKLHDDLEDIEDKSSLVDAIANLYATLFSCNKEDLLTASRHRVQATLHHDLAEHKLTPPPLVQQEWGAVKQELTEFYTQLQIVVNSKEH